MASMFATMRRLLNSKGYVLYASVISIGGLLNGYDTGSIGAVTTMPQFSSTISTLTPIMHGFAVSLIMITGALPSVFTGALGDRYGHLHVVMAGAIIFTVGVTLEGGAQALPMFLVGRALAGFGQGLWVGNVSVYITEIAPSARRGTLVSMPQLMAALGVCTGYFTCYITVRLPNSFSFRIPFIIQAIFGFLLALSCLYLPPSPRWLLLNNRRDEALKALERLDIPRAEAEKDILRPAVNEHRSLQMRDVLQIFGKEYVGRTSLGLFILGFVQLCGIDGVLYYAPIIFTQAGLPAGTSSFLASGLSSILMLAISIPAFLYADRWGRRASVIIGGILLSSSMYVIGGLYATDSVHKVGVGRWVVIIGIFVFALSYVGTWGVVGKIYASEIQPARVRGAANSVAQGLGFFTNWLVAFTTPIFLSRSTYGAYFLFGSFSLVAVIFLSIYMPETRGHSLEAIQEGFQGGRMKWSGRKVLRWFAGPKFSRLENEFEMSGGNGGGLLVGEGVLAGSLRVDVGSV